MPTKIDKTTLVPISVMISVTIFFLYLSANVVTKYVKLESKVNNLENNYKVQANQLSGFNIQVSELNENMIRLSEIIKKLEEKIK